MHVSAYACICKHAMHTFAGPANPWDHTMGWTVKPGTQDIYIYIYTTALTIPLYVHCVMPKVLPIFTSSPEVCTCFCHKALSLIWSDVAYHI